MLIQVKFKFKNVIEKVWLYSFKDRNIIDLGSYQRPLCLNNQLA